MRMGQHLSCVHRTQSAWGATFKLRNALLALGMSIVVVVFIAEAIRYIAQGAWLCGWSMLRHFYDPATFAPG